MMVLFIMRNTLKISCLFFQLIRRLSPPILEEIYFSKLPNTHLDLLIAGGINHEYIKGFVPI